MTNTSDVPNTYTEPQQPGPPQYASPAQEPKQKNTLGLIALIVASVGFIFACIPGALIIGWILLPIAFILSLVSLFLKGKGKALSITALIVSIVGTIIGFVVFFAVVAASVDEAFGGGETTVTTPTQPTGESPAAEEPAEAAAGSRENPYPIGSVIEQGDWAVTLNGVNLDATADIANENPYNEPAPEGSIYILANVTATYVGDDPNGDMPFISVDYVTVDGNTIKTYATTVLTPAPFDLATTLYNGASTTGNFAFAVPAATAAEGVFAITPGMVGDKIFVAVQ